MATIEQRFEEKYIPEPTQTDNMRDCIAKGRLPRRPTKVSDSDFDKIRSLKGELRFLADAYGISKTYVCAIQNGRAKRRAA